MTNGSLLSTSIVLEWSPTAEGMEYEIAFANNRLLTSEPQILIEGLTPRTTYQFRVRAKADDKVGDWSEPLKVSTMKMPSNIPDGLYCVEKSSDFITLSWEPVENAVKYEILFNEKVLSASTNVYKIEGLNKDTFYLNSPKL